MSDLLTALPPSAFDAFPDLSPPAPVHAPHAPADTALDFFSFHSPADILAPHPDQFESELDSSLAQFDDADLNLALLVDAPDPFAFLRSDTPTHHYRPSGPPSTLTVSSESASGYDSLSSYSESFYNPASPALGSSYSFPLDLDMDFQRIRVDPLADYAAHAQAQAAAAAKQESLTQAELAAVLTDDPTSFGPLPPSPPHKRGVPAGLRSPPGAVYHQRARSGAYSDYVPGAPSGRGSATSDYYPQLSHSRHPSLSTLQQAQHAQQHHQHHSQHNGQQRTVSPSSVSSTDMSSMSMPITPPIPLVSGLRGADQSRHNNADSGSDDGRKKYKCVNCPRSFARAFNLKTHMSTHDPNRPKPHVCPHKACGRSFSRKHDLGRHLVSIHREEHGLAIAAASNGGAAAARADRVNGVSVGVVKGPRGWCETCGKGWVGRDKGCSCDDIK